MMTVRLFYGLLVVAASLGCGSGESKPAPKPVLMPIESEGAYWSGTFSGEYRRADGHAVTTQVWYPTSDEEGHSVRFDDIFESDSWDNARPACNRSRPVVVFSHGNAGIRWQTAFNMHFLATHGFVVVAMDHPSNTIVDHSPDNRVEHILDRPLDVRDTFNWLKEITSHEAHPLNGCIDPNAGYAVMGHAFGGYTALMVAGASIHMSSVDSLCSRGDKTACGVSDRWQTTQTSDRVERGDQRVWAVVTLAPSDLGGLLSNGTADMSIPSLTITGTMDEQTSVQQVSTLVSHMHSADYATLIDAGHFSFAPVSCLIRSDDGCGEDNMDVSRVKTLTNRLVTAFLATQLGWQNARRIYRAMEHDDLEWQQRHTFF